MPHGILRSPFESLSEILSVMFEGFQEALHWASMMLRRENLFRMFEYILFMSGSDNFLSRVKLRTLRESFFFINESTVNNGNLKMCEDVCNIGNVSWALHIWVDDGSCEPSNSRKIIGVEKLTKEGLFVNIFLFPFLPVYFTYFYRKYLPTFIIQGFGCSCWLFSSFSCACQSCGL